MSKPLTPTCGYQGHYCHPNSVQFISRYRDENDYCVGGTRVSVRDDGSTHVTCQGDATPEQIKRILLFELQKYAEYCQWNAEQRLTHADWPALSEFRYSALAEVSHAS